MGVGNPEQIGIGERQEDDVARILPEIDRSFALVEGDRVDAQEVHGATSSRERGGDGTLVEALEADHDETAVAGL
ncbi:MAG TPA: hypothetical protein VF606_05665, partial [Geminicoccaceae bacterium]